MSKKLVVTEGIDYTYVCPVCLSIVNYKDNFCKQCSEDLRDGEAYSLDELATQTLYDLLIEKMPKGTEDDGHNDYNDGYTTATEEMKSVINKLFGKENEL